VIKVRFDVLAVLSVYVSTAPSLYRSLTHLDGLDAHRVVRHRLGTVSAADLPVTGATICVDVHVNPPTDGPTQRRILESNYADNADRECVIIPPSKEVPADLSDLGQRREDPPGLPPQRV